MVDQRPRRPFLRVDAFRLALYAGLLVTLLHLLQVVSRSRDAEFPVVGRIESAVQDWAITRLRGPRPTSGRVVIVAIDERSVQAEGKWPWSRAQMALLVDRLAEGGVAAAGFDVVWSDEDELPRRLARLNRLLAEAAAEPGLRARLAPIAEAARGAERRFPADVDPTEQLAAAIERAGNVAVGFTFLSPADASPERHRESIARARFLRAEPLHQRDGLGKLVPAGGAPAFGTVFAGLLTPVDEILAVADAGGFFQVFPDPDAFIPERFAPEAKAALPKGAYVPFGGGSRTCIGMRFGQLEIKAIATLILQRFRLEPAPGWSLSVRQMPTLSPRGGLPVLLRPRAA